jgi:ABC-type transport system involved in multi-copper enzyme maturation permease subunit
MFLHLVRKELLEQLLSLRFALACIICLVIVLSSAFVLARDYSEALADYRTNVIMHKKEVEDSPGNLIWNGIKVDKPVNPMHIFFKGIDHELTRSATVNSWSEPQFEADYEHNPVNFLVPAIDLAVFIGIVMSLMAIAFSYDAISGEKESGTLKLLMSYSLPRDLVLLAKWAGGYVALITPFLLSMLSGLTVILSFEVVELESQHWAALGLVLAVALLYLGAIYSLGVFVSARTHLASTSITLLLLIWVLVVLVVPNLAPYAASQLHPLRSIIMIDREKHTVEIEENSRFEAAWDTWRDENPTAAPWQTSWSTFWYTERRIHLLKTMSDQHKIDVQFQKEMDAQIRLAQYLSRISPLASFTYAVTDLAGTGIYDRGNFDDLLPTYRRDITNFGIDKYLELFSKEKWDWSNYEIEGYPQFKARESKLEDRISFPDILVLVMWAVLFFMGAYLSFLRYDVK